jgi:hypothetical protein
MSPRLRPLLSLLCLEQVVDQTYDNLGITVIAVEMYSRSLQKERVVLNPNHLTIPSVFEYRVHVYVIAEDKKQADLMQGLFSSTHVHRVHLLFLLFFLNTHTHSFAHL